ncbi:ABC-type metal ion transport system, permease component [Bombilactobacillus mellis]|uniref:ABC-type metal ion transport system, permease component n=1 Tax=Bombilactobacillus mellis TaxID=1218508 RepID=A0A0F4KRB3_9LACO|nr:methionine ABC transporter permease [Bombilactobacillus mellis]MBI0107236.1 ABC transporter permease [Lactobacillus sp. W8086]MBI0108701.1 ABC transporter permease [Lactobacillus sp. W8085]MBI0111918.1 ABC transporter permease [Lactobacillus sp. W8088]MBI0115634.1 ABC transporter permease [Lactobacillus sp. W8087]MBI0119358.1 ABC transporter permease [Lactobacillus sp. W8089]MBI0131324.1 ABC transporter permease [Lactobacillus sp. W8090]
MWQTISSWMPNVVANWSGDNGFEIAIYQTLYMTFVSAVFAGILGLILGVALLITDEQGILPQKHFYYILDKLVNLFRSIPFVILLAVIGPFTKLVVGQTIGPTGALVPLIVGTAPFFARQVQLALVEVDPGIIEAAQAMGLSPWQIIYHVYLKEGLPELIRSATLTLISLIGLTAMAGAVGGGGLGNMAIAVGYQRFENDVTIVSMILILILVFIVQGIGDFAVRKLQH